MATAAASAPLGAQSWCSGCSTYAGSKTLACGKCRLAWYHSKGCQLSAWPEHKQLCSKSLLWSPEALPADLLLCHRSVTPERIRGWVDGLLAPQTTAAAKRRGEAVSDLLRALPVLPHEAVGRLGLMPGLTRILSVLEEKDKGEDAAAVTAALNVLVRCLQGSQLNARLLFLCGGAFELARLVFVALPADHPDLASALSALRATLVESQDAKCVQATLLGHGPPQQALVPVLLRLMDPVATAEGDCSPLRRLQQQQDAANLLSLALTLQAEAPREMWVEGFEVVARLVEEYLGMEGNGKAEGHAGEEDQKEAFERMLRCMLLEVCGLVDGFVEHFPGAVESVIDKGLPALLDRLLGYPGALDVRADATVTARLALTFAGSQASVDALVWEGKVLKHAGAMVAGAVADVVGAVEEGQQAGSSSSSSGSSKKEKKKAAAASFESQRPLARQQQGGGGLILLKAGLALASDCLRADPIIVAPHLPRLLPAIAAVVTTPALALARTQALACLLSALVHIPRSVLLAGKESPLLTPAMGAGLGALLLLPLSPAGQDKEQDNGGGEENSPTTLGLLAADAVALLAGRFITHDADTDDPAWAFLTKTVRALPVLSRQITAAAPAPKAGRPPLRPVARGAVLALQALLWARPATVLPELRADKALRAAVAVLAESGTETALDFAYLHWVLEGEEVGESLLEGTPVRTADWLEAVGLQRSAVQTVASERLLAYLGVRKEAVCAASGTELAVGDRVVRLSKCRHFLLEAEMRALVLTDDEGEEGQGYVRYWKGREAALEALDERLRCPKCGRHMRVDVRD